MARLSLEGWVELEGRQISEAELAEAVAADPGVVSRLGGEFLLSWNGCLARDRMGIIPGPIPPGTIVCSGTVTGTVDPPVPVLGLEEAISRAVSLRSTEGSVVALSGGVDSALVAGLARRPCIAVGVEGSHDLARASRAAALLHLTCDLVVIGEPHVEEALRAVVPVIPDPSPLNASIAATLFWVASRARELGHTRVLAGQGADELFGGYARYLTSHDLAADLERDFQGMERQAARDQAVAALHGVWFSLPYLDLRVVRAARLIPPARKVSGGMRKTPLREVAAYHIPAELAFSEKKAMQYGSGVWKALVQLARREGYRRAGDYIDSLVGS